MSANSTTYDNNPLPRGQKIPFLDHTNYQRWENAISVYLDSKLALGIVHGDEQPPAPRTWTIPRRIIAATAQPVSSSAPPTMAAPASALVPAPVVVPTYFSSDPDMRDYLERSKLACQLIYSHCSTSTQMLIENIRGDPRRMWLLLKETYDNMTTESSRYLYGAFAQERPGSYPNLQAFANKLIQYQWDLQDTQNSINDGNLRHQLTAYLPDEYAPTVIFHHESTWTKLLDALNTQEQQLQNRKNEIRALSAASTNAASNNRNNCIYKNRSRNRANANTNSAGNSTGNSNANSNINRGANTQCGNRQGGNSGGIRKHCYHCGKPGHIQKDCRIKAAGARVKAKDNAATSYTNV